MHASKEFPRRHFVRLMGGFLGLLTWHPAWAAREIHEKNNPKIPALAPGDVHQVIEGLLKGRGLQSTDQIVMEIPDAAENGALVPLSARSAIEGTRALHLIADQNPGPWLATFRFEAGVRPFVSTRVKLNASGSVRVLAETSLGFFERIKQVRVMVGGCG